MIRPHSFLGPAPTEAAQSAPPSSLGWSPSFLLGRRTDNCAVYTAASVGPTIILGLESLVPAGQTHGQLRRLRQLSQQLSRRCRRPWAASRADARTAAPTARLPQSAPPSSMGCIPPFRLGRRTDSCAVCMAARRIRPRVCLMYSLPTERERWKVCARWSTDFV